LGALGSVTLNLWDVNEGQQVAAMSNHTARITATHWNQDGSRLISASLDGTLRLWHPQSGRELLALEVPEQVNAAAWSPHGMQIVAGDSTGKLRFFDAFQGYRRERSDVLLSDLNRRIGDGSATAEERILRGQIHAGAGRWKLAEQDFSAVSSEQDRDEDSPAWFGTPWWVLGPFDPNDENSPAVDAVGDPFSKLSAGQASTDVVEVATWQPGFSGDPDHLNLRDYFQPADDIFCYAFTRYYSPREQSVGLLLGSDDGHRIWLNGNLVHEDRGTGGASADETAVLVNLQPGWNTILAKVTNTWGGYDLYLRLSTNALDLANAFERSGNWQAALEQWHRALASDPDDVALLVRRSQAATKAGRFEQAIEDLSRLIDKIPLNMTIAVWLHFDRMIGD
jgi:tetratricopeptide (TPR) repeat protein